MPPRHGVFPEFGDVGTSRGAQADRWMIKGEFATNFDTFSPGFSARCAQLAEVCGCVCVARSVLEGTGVLGRFPRVSTSLGGPVWLCRSVAKAHAMCLMKQF